MLLVYFILTFLASLILTFFVRQIMIRFQIIDEPKKQERKIHRDRIPLGGGWAIFLSFFIASFVALYLNKIGQDVLPKYIWGLFLGGMVLMIGGFIDDKYSWRARYQLIFAILAILIVIGFGVGPEIITNPYGGSINLAIPVVSAVNWLTLSNILVFFWLLGMMFTTKLLDGLDGLVTGIVTIGAIMIFFLSRQAQWFQPEISLLSIIFAGACLGFLVWNWHPAKIFLGQGGSMFTGFMLGSLAILAGGKIATTLLVIGVPMLDMIRVIVLRLLKRKSVFVGDKEHLHFRLIESGLNQRQAVLLLYSISFLFGLSALFLQSSQKIVALMILLLLMIMAGIWFSRNDK